MARRKKRMAGRKNLLLNQPAGTASLVILSMTVEEVHFVALGLQDLCDGIRKDKSKDLTERSKRALIRENRNIIKFLQNAISMQVENLT